MSKRIISILLFTILLFTLLPVGNAPAAAETTEADGTGNSQVLTSLAPGDVVILVSKAYRIELEGLHKTADGADDRIDPDDPDAYATCGGAFRYAEAPEGVYPLTVEAGASEGSVAFRLPKGCYLANLDGSESLSFLADVTPESSWNISFAENGVALVSNCAFPDMAICANAASTQPFFRCSGSGDREISLPSFYKCTRSSYTASDEYRDVPENPGVRNALLNMKQLIELTYTTPEEIPAQAPDNRIAAGETISGVLYSSSRPENGFVPNYISFDTYLSAVASPRSYLHTVDLMDPEAGGFSWQTNGRSYYGAVCSSAVLWALNFDILVPTVHWADIDGMDLLPEQDLTQLKLGDIICTRSSGHVVMVTGITRNHRGVIKFVTISQASISSCKAIVLTLAELKARYPSNKWAYFRYRYLDSVKHTQIPYVAVGDETPQSYTLNVDVVPKKGDKCNYRTDETVALDCYGDNFTELEIRKDGTAFATEPFAETVTLGLLPEGRYAARLTGDGESSEWCEWIVVNTASGVTDAPAAGAINVTFPAKTSLAVPDTVMWVYPQGSKQDAFLYCEKISDADAAAGSASSVYLAGTYGVRIGFRTEFGVIFSKTAKVKVTCPAHTHTAGAPVRTLEVPATCTDAGGYDTVVLCEICHVVMQRDHTELPAMGHTPGEAYLENRVRPTCTERGSYDTVVYCTHCQTELSRSYTESAATGHNYQTSVAVPTCTEGGYTIHTCGRCGDVYYTDLTVALRHDWTDWIITAAPTCLESGIITRTCIRCNEIETCDVRELGHHLISYAAAAPTCTDIGWNEYNACTRCDYTTRVEIEALGHDYQAEVTDPTCLEAGYTTCTCSRCHDSYTADETKPLGHSWGETIYVWSEDNSSVTATRVCARDASHIEAETVNTSSEITKPATCTEKGDTTYTATFENTAFATQTKTVINVDANGHTPGTAVEENRVEPTCTEKGGYDTVVYCTVCKAELSREHTELDALGHDWNESTYEWTEDNSTVTATRVCKNDETHAETETVTTTSEVTKEATVDEEGEITYTATFTNPAFETQTKKVATPKLERSNPFEDVAEGKFYYDAVLWAVAHEPQITNGTDATHFSPDATCTRGQVVTFLWRAKGCPETASLSEGRGVRWTPNERSEAEGGNPFTDVKEGSFYYKAVLWAVENEITNGTSATTFSPNNGCTRGQVVTFLWRTEGKPEPTTENNPFTDVTGGFYYKAVLWAVENGITNGTSATSFSPSATCTRGQIVTFLYRALAE